MPSSEPVNWQPLSQLPLVAGLIDDAREGTEKQRRILSEARERPHLLDDATLDRIDRVYGEQLGFLDIYERQIERWRRANPSAAQKQEMDRLATETRSLRTATTELLALASELRKGTIDRIMEASDLQLGLKALLDTPPRRRR